MTSASPPLLPPSRRARIARLVLYVALGLWALVPIAQLGTAGQDAIPLLAAGKLVRSDPEAIYTTPTTSSHDTNPTFFAAACKLYPEGVDCAPLVVPFSPSPLALPFALALGAVGATPGTFLLRAVGALALVVGFLSMARRLDLDDARTAAALAGGALLLTPYVWFTLRFGQTIPLLFLAASLGVAATETKGAVAAGRSALLATTIALKAFPLAVLVVAVLQRRWRLLVATVAWLVLLAALTLAVAPPSTFSAFLRSTQGGSSVAAADPYNRGLDGLIGAVVDWRTAGAAYLVSIALRVAAVVALWRRRVRHLDDDAQWAWAWLVLLLLSPVVWLHYQWLVVAAVVHALRTRRTLQGAAVLTLPALAAVLSALAMRNTPDATILFLAGAVLLAAIGGAPFLAQPPGRRRAGSRQSAAVPAR